MCMPIPTLTEPQEARFWAKVDKRGPDECWPWTAGTDGSGYGKIKIAGVIYGAHRVALTLANGPIADDHEPDHTCRNRRCVNPAHLDPVTHHENVLRSTSPTARNAAKTHCCHGHAFTPENTYIGSDGGRRCRTCKRASARRELREAA